MKCLFCSLLVLLSGQTIAAPPPGHPSVGDAAQIMQLPAAGQFPFEGTVDQAIDSNNYTYVLLSTVRGPLWLAAPRQPLTAGQRLRFPQGSLMRNFYSKKLKRTFDQVLFVRALQVLPQ